MKKITIIGAGITGLSAGINALLKGHQVTIYEKNNFVGGCASGWYREGYYIDNCMHWLTGTNQFTKEFKDWKKVGAITETSNLYQGEYFFKSIKDGNSIAMLYDTKKTRLDMLKLSSEDRVEINKFMDAVEEMIKVNQDHKLIGNIINKILNYPSVYLKYHKLSLEDLSNKFKHPLLRQLFIDYLPKEYSALSLIFSYATFASGNGKVYKGGTLEFSKHIFDTFLSLGGTLHLNSEITSINISNEKVTTITINNSDLVMCDYLIYTGDPYYLFNNLLDNSYIPYKLKEKFNDKNAYPIHSSYHSAYLLKKNVNPINDTVVFDIPSIKVGTKTIDRLFMKDYSYLYENKDKTVIQSFIIQDMDDYDYWESLKKKNPKEYNKVKNEIGNNILDILTNKFGISKDDIKMLDTWTPLTYTKYFNSYYGSYMGFSITNKCNCFKITNKIKGINNLYLATVWQRLCGGLPVALKHGEDVVKYI